MGINEDFGDPACNGPPPRPTELYGRFGEGLDLLDIGSGNCGKLTTFTGSLHITVCDKELTETPHVVKRLRGSIEKNLGELSSYSFLTSFMSLIQIDPQVVKEIIQFDGLHMIPDHENLMAAGIAKRSGDLIEVRTSKRVYFDNELELPGMSPKVGYKLCPTYLKRSISVLLSVEPGKGEVIFVDATPDGIEEINYNDVTYKYDGVPYELELHLGQAYLTDRLGTSYLGVTDFTEHLCVQLEQLTGCYVLLRVLSFKGFVPPHNGDCLRLFANNVKILIDGLPVLGPEKYDPRRVPTLPIDGLISRREERDYYFKPVWTVDIYGENIDVYRKGLRKEGYNLKYDLRPGLWEYQMIRQEADVVLRPLKPRVDKVKSTSLETVVYLLGKRTLSEMEALMGSPWLRK